MESFDREVEIATKHLLQLIESKRQVTDFETTVLSAKLLITGTNYETK